MIRKKKYSSEENRPVKLLMAAAEAEVRLKERIDKGLELKSREINSEKELKDSRRHYYSWSDYNKELLERMFTTKEKANEYQGSAAGAFAVGPEPLYVKIQNLHDDIDYKIRRLQSIIDRLELIPVDESIGIVQTAPEQDRKKINTEKIFLVHGHDEAAREAVARFIERLDLKPIILHEEASKGQTIIEKLEKNSDVGYAIVILTPDDEGKEKGKKHKLNDRARQNVILELGFFIGKLGRNCVCALLKDKIEIPSDYLGVLYIQLDESGGWKLQIAKELKEAGYSIDMDRVIDI